MRAELLRIWHTTYDNCAEAGLSSLIDYIDRLEDRIDKLEAEHRPLNEEEEH